MSEGGRCIHRAVVVDDHPLLAFGLGAELERAGVATELAPLLSPAELVDWIGERSPDCLVVDLGLPIEGGGLALIGPAAARGVRVAVLTGETDLELWARCVVRGAEVVLAKSEPMADLVDAIVAVCAREPVRPQQRAHLLTEARRLEGERKRRLAPFGMLSRRERAVLGGLMDGHGPAQLAERDFVSVQTVRSQIKSVLRKLDARSQLEAVARAHACGWSPEVDSGR